MGADTERVYTLFLGPPEDEVEWNDEAVSGAYRFLKRLWRAAEAARRGAAHGARRRRARAAAPRHHPARHPRLRALQVQHRGGGADGAAQRADPALEEKTASQGCLRSDARHAAAAAASRWRRTSPRSSGSARGHEESLLESAWPDLRRRRSSRRDRLTLVVQVDGKLRDRVEVDADAGESEVRAAALAERQGAGASAGPRAGQGGGGARTPGQPGDPEVDDDETLHGALHRLSLLRSPPAWRAAAATPWWDGRANLPADVKSVYLKPLENRTQRSQVEQILTRAGRRVGDPPALRGGERRRGGGRRARGRGAVGFGVTPVTFDDQRPRHRVRDLDHRPGALQAHRQRGTRSVEERPLPVPRQLPGRGLRARLLRPRETWPSRRSPTSSPRPW